MKKDGHLVSESTTMSNDNHSSHYGQPRFPIRLTLCRCCNNGERGAVEPQNLDTRIEMAGTDHAQYVYLAAVRTVQPRVRSEWIGHPHPSLPRVPRRTT